jgi:beta-lactamase superfamily II metal-dependent hydrolase
MKGKGRVTMKQLECIIFNVEHGFCAFINSPNKYGYLIDCGERQGFSPIKWIKQHYNVGAGNIQYHQGRRIAKMTVTHLHADHFSDIGSFHGPAKDRPKTLLRDKKTLKYIDEKIKEGEDKKRVDVLKKFKEFQKKYDQDVEKVPDWGFDFFDERQINVEDAENISADRDKIINNRSFLISIEYAGKKILIPGDIETEGWDKAFKYSSIKEILKGTNFFVTSHHGRKSGCNSDMLTYTGIPDIYSVS